MTTHRKLAPEARRRRTCWDRLRIQRHRHRRKATDPAMSAFLQLLALLAVIWRMPVPTPRPLPWPSPARPVQRPRRDDWSPGGRGARAQRGQPHLSTAPALRRREVPQHTDLQAPSARSSQALRPGARGGAGCSPAKAGPATGGPRLDR